MKGWTTKSLGDLCELENGDRGENYPSKSTLVTTGVPFINAGHIEKGQVDPSAVTYITPEHFPSLRSGKIRPNDILFCLRGSLGKFASVGNLAKGAIASSLVIIRPNAELFDKFLLAYLESDLCQSEIKKYANGAAQPNLGAASLKKFSIPLPPIEEQKRIVAILDGAFEGIARATANAERNLANARELFDNRVAVLFGHPPKSWRRTTLRDVCDGFEYGTSTKSRKSGEVPVLRMGNLQSGSLDWTDLVYANDEAEVDRYALKDGDVLFNRTNSAEHVGKAAIYRNERKAIFAGYLIRVRYKREFIDGEFLNYYLNSPVARDYGRSVMAQSVNQANISGSKLKDYPFSYPGLEEQVSIGFELKELQTKSCELAELYKNKIGILSQLKKTLLNKAFSGDLTSAKEHRPVATIDTLEVTASPQYTADVLAFAYAKHRSAQRDRTFGRVKGQKVLHLVEAVAGVDLGRDPIKDAAGPNDSAHMRRAEAWAEQQGYFAFEARGTGGYDFTLGPNFEKILASVYARLSPNKDAIAKVIDLLVPMDSQDAEVLATVHAAWNNLIIDGVEPTLDTIIAEARENWAASKLEIPVSKFEKAIRFIRRSDIIPDGSAKPVRARQESLF